MRGFVVRQGYDERRPAGFDPMDGSTGNPGDYDAIENLRQNGYDGIGGLSELRYES